MSGQIPLGLWTNFAQNESGWEQKVNQNFDVLDWHQYHCITAQVATAGDLPGSPNVGDNYLVGGTEVHRWYDSQWHIIQLLCPLVFYDETIGELFLLVSGVATSLAMIFAGVAGVPIGATLPFDDFGVLTLPTNYRWCNGDLIVAPGSPIDGLQTRDLSGLYIMGYGTIGGADIDSEPYDPNPVGNDGHEVDFEHDHVVNAHTHAHAHTHNMASHRHDLSDNGWAMISGEATNDTMPMQLTGAPGAWNSTRYADVNIVTNPSPSDPQSSAVPLGGETDGPSTNTTGGASSTNTSSSSPGTSDSLALMNIQPKTSKFRMIVKVL